MPKKLINEEQRKISCSISLPRHLSDILHTKGSTEIVALIRLGLVAQTLKFNQDTIPNLHNHYEEKIAKLQRIIEDGQKD